MLGSVALRECRLQAMEAEMKLLLALMIFVAVPVIMGAQVSCEKGGGLAPTVHLCKAHEGQVACEDDAACAWTDNGCKAK